MRPIIRNALITAGAMFVCTAATAHASPTTTLKANVRFPFEVAGQQFPAGKYEIQRDDLLPSVLLIRSENMKHAAFVLTNRDGGKDPAGSQAVLTFKRYENQYRLSSVWDSADQGWDLAHR